MINRALFCVVLAAYVRKVRSRYGPGIARQVRTDTKKEYKELLPYLPNVGGFRNYFAAIVVANGWFIATYKALRSSGHTAAETMAIWAELIDGIFRKVPAWLQRQIGRFLTSDRAIAGFHRQAARSQLREFPADWVYQVNDVEGVDLALEFQECAAIKMYRRFDVEEMAPYCSLADVTYSAYLGLGLDASETLGLGFPSCKLYYQREGAVKYNARIQPVLPARLVEHPHTQSVPQA